MAAQEKITLKALLKKFSNNGEKTGWTYFLIPSKISNILYPGRRKSFRVRGNVDDLTVERVALIPDGKGNFIFPFNQSMRKATGKKEGAYVHVTLSKDLREIEYDGDLLLCLEDDSDSRAFFNKLSPSQRGYFSKWVESAKTAQTKDKRIAEVLNALSRGMNFPEMYRDLKKRKD